MNRRTRITTVALIAVMAVAAAIRFYHLDDKALFGDEAYTHWLAVMPLGKTVAAAAGERNPPLPTALIHFWFKVAPRHSEFWLRLPFMLFGVASIPLLFVLGRRTAGDTAAIAACILYSFSPLMINFSQFARYPTIEIFLILAMTLFVIIYIDTGRFRWLLVFAVSSALALYTHYFMLYVMFAFCFSFLVFFRERERICGLCASALAFTAFLPWMPKFLNRAGSDVGLQSLETIIAYLKTKPFFAVPHVLQNYLIGSYDIQTIQPLLFVAFAVCVGVVFTFSLSWAVRDRKGAIILSTVFIPLFSVYLSKFIIGFEIEFFYRISCGLAPLFFLCLAIGWTRMNRAAAAVTFALFMGVFGASIYFHMITLHPDQNSRTAFVQVETMKQPGDVFILIPPQCESLFHFYGPQEMPVIGIPARMDPINYNPVDHAKWPAVDAAFFRSLEKEIAQYSRAWVFWCGSVSNSADPYGTLLDLFDYKYSTVLNYNFYITPGSTHALGLLKLYRLENIPDYH